MIFKEQFASVEYVAQMVNQVVLMHIDDAKKIKELQHQVMRLYSAVSVLADQIKELESKK